MSDIDERRLTVGEHLEELRSRVLRALLGLLAAVVVCWFLRDYLMDWVLYPYRQAADVLPQLSEKLITIRPQESFVVHMKVALIAGLFLASPFVLYQLWGFVAAGLYRHERGHVTRYLPVSVGLLLVGIAFGYFLLIPYALRFLLGFAIEIVDPLIDLAEYISLFFTLTLMLGLIFQLPLVMMFFARIGLCTPKTFARRRALGIVLAFLFAALLTPPDMITQALLAGPLVALYELGVLFARLGHARYRRLHASEAAEPPASKPEPPA